MDQSEPIKNRILSLIRRRFFPLWLASTWPYVLEALCMISIAFAVHGRAPSGQPFDPNAVWKAESALNKAAIMLAFIAQIFVPPDLGAVGVAMIVRSDQQGRNLVLKSLVSRYARLVWLVVPLSIALGVLTLLGGLFFLPGIFFAIWRAFVMPALATAQDNLGKAIRHSFRLSLRRFVELFGLALATTIAQVPAVLALGVPIIAAGGGRLWWVGLVVGWTLFTGLEGLIFMTRSLVLALLYLDAVRHEETAPTPLLVAGPAPGC